VRQLLTLAREEPGDAEKPLAPVNLAELARLVIAEHLGLAEAKGLDLGASKVDDEAIVTGDFEALRILLGNLVENAIRYTPGGTIDVAAGVADGIPFVEVSDSGPGIPADERQRVFDRFYRRPGTAEPGSGLGLAIVKAIADRHSAELTLDDAALGGLRVRVDFPPQSVGQPGAASSRGAIR
jgi:two-component system, OmpR family, sensor kinase